MRHIHLLACAVAATAMSASIANAQETGIHKMHATTMSGGKLCLATHEHVGESLPSGTQKVAMATAINNWVRFTADEYGKSWGNHGLAAGKWHRCKGAEPNIVCQVFARPCRGR